MEFKDDKKIKIERKRTKKSLKDIYKETKITNPLQLAKEAGVSATYARNFLKKNIAELEVLSNSKIDLKKVDYVPAGSSNTGHWQADIMFLHDYKRLAGNKKHLAVLTLLNTNTRQANARGLKTSTAREITSKMKEMIYETGRL